ncbi:MAG: hypothetical protein ACRDPO_18150, partial [Streptosporangiaceae bacterium]
GHVSCRFLPTGNEVMVSWAFAIAAKTAVTNGETIVTLPSGYHYDVQLDRHRVVVRPGHLHAQPRLTRAARQEKHHP